MAPRKKKKEEEHEEAPKKKRVTKKRSPKKEVKKEEAFEKEPTIQSSVPPEYFEKTSVIPPEEKKEDISEEMVEPFVVKPKIVLTETREKVEYPILDEVKTEKVEEPLESDETVFDAIEKFDTHESEPVEVKKEQVFHEPDMSFDEDTKEVMIPQYDKLSYQSESLWLRHGYYTAIALVSLFVVYVFLGRFVFTETLSYESQAPLVVPDVEVSISDTESESQIEITSTPTGYLRVRSGPSTEDSEVLKVFPGDRYAVVSTKGDWVEIDLGEGATGWIFAEYAESLSD